MYICMYMYIYTYVHILHVQVWNSLEVPALDVYMYIRIYTCICTYTYVHILHVQVWKSLEVPALGAAAAQVESDFKR